MPELVQILQLASGLLWLLTALYLTPRIGRSWRKEPSRATMLAAPIGFLAWLMFGFCFRWLLWPESLGEMGGAELTTWAALYALSSLLAVWFFQGALQTRND